MVVDECLVVNTEKKSCQKSKKNSESTVDTIYIFFYLADSGGMFYLVHLLHYVHKSTRYIKAQHIQLSVTHTVKLFTNHSSVMSTHTHPISEKDRHKQQKIIYLKGGGRGNECLFTYWLKSSSLFFSIFKDSMVNICKNIRQYMRGDKT